MRRRRILLTIALGVVALVAAGVYIVTTSIRNAPLTLGTGDTLDVTVEADSADIPFGAPGRDLALMSNQGGSWDVLILAADGTQTNLTTGTDNDAAHDYFPSWAMDGGQLNFLSTRLDPTTLGPTQINADGTGLRNLDIVSAIFSVAASGRFDWDPAWSPDGKRLLWSSLRDTNLELYLIDLDKEFVISNATRVTDNPARDWFGAWSPDSGKIARASDVSGNEDIYLYDVATSTDTALTDSEWDDFRVVWSLDGTQLLYISDENDDLTKGVLHHYLIAPDGSNPHPLGDAVFEGGAVWSPDGEQVAYITNASGRWQIIVMNTDGSNQRRITPDDADYLYPVWKP